MGGREREREGEKEGEREGESEGRRKGGGMQKLKIKMCTRTYMFY